MKILIFFTVLMPLQAFCQLSDNFETGLIGGWQQNISGRWGIDSLSPLSGKYSLWHSFDNSEAGTDCISLPLYNLHPAEGTVKWSFLIRYACDPSSSNNWCFFLLSDLPATEMIKSTGVSGFAVGVNLTGYDDTLRLWKIKNGEVQKFISTTVNWLNDVGTSIPAEIISERTASGQWSVIVRLPGGISYGPFTGTDNELFYPCYTGIFYRYTSTRDRLLWFDDLVVEGPFIEDKEPPKIAGYKLISRNSVEITMSEEVCDCFITASNFLLNNFVMPAEDALKTGKATYRLIFDDDFPNRQLCQLKILNVCDRESNCISELIVSFMPAWAEPGDVVITEIMADPEPPVYLPQREYLEIMCRSSVPLSLKGWWLRAGNRIFQLPDITTSSDEYLIICSETDSALFSKYGRVAGMKSFPELLNSGACLVLTDSSGNMIHGVEYTDRWYNDNLKAVGGWSLEMVDTDFPFHYESNWKASVSTLGGTPGQRNSVAAENPDMEFEGITNVFPVNENELKVVFSEPVRILPGFGDEFYINDRPAFSSVSSDPLCREYSVFSGEKLEIRQIYTLSLSAGYVDFAGNGPVKKSFQFGIPEITEKGDIVFNELLFNPLPGDARYVEFFNLSSKIIDAASLSVSSKSTTTGSFSSPLPLSDNSRCLLPGSYYAITTDRNSVIMRYYTSDGENIFNIKQLPSMSGREGHLILFNKQLEVIDETQYDENQHFPLLTNKEGVALEKINPSVPSINKSNWHSATADAGWGTPGAENSVYVENIASEKNVSFSLSRITPDNDGVEDFLVITFNFPGREIVTNVTIFDENGFPLKKPVVNYYIGHSGVVFWDGTDADGTVVPAGIYIVYVTVFDEKGKTGSWKKACAVLRR